MYLISFMDPTFLIFQLIVLLMSVVIHEVSHGAVANALGDPTAKYAGRLSLNPLKHLDPIGSVFLPLFLFLMKSPFIFGWAKPVPYNPYNLRDQRWGSAKVALAGPGANLLMALFFGIGIRVGLATGEISQNVLSLFTIIVVINLILAVFNLLPIPPLDGSKLLFSVLPYRAQNLQIFLERYGFLILILFLFVAFRLIWPLVNLLFTLIVGIPLF